jgi:hypothetical protein
MKRILFTLCAALILMLANPFSIDAQSRRPPSGGGGGGGGGGGRVAAPRGGGGQHSSPPPSGSGAVSRGASGGSNGAYGGQARPRSTGGVYGTAVPRSQFGGRIVVPPYYHGYSPWYYYSPYAFGVWGIGYWGWDPYWWGYPYGYGGYPYGWGYGYYGSGPYGGYYNDYGDQGPDYGSLRLKVKPKDAEVYVDSYYMGQVDDFDGSWQHLDLESGTHRIEIRANGYQPLVFEIRLAPGRTVNYQGQLKKGPGN